MATIARRRPLDKLPRTVCPAAQLVAGATKDRGGVICAVMAMDRGREAGLDMNPAQLEIARRGGEGDVFLTLAGDPSTVENFCCGDAVPVLSDRDLARGRDSYTYCPVWQAEKDRIEAGRSMLSEPVPAPEPISHGVSTADSVDPWAQARHDVRVFAEG